MKLGLFHGMVSFTINILNATRWRDRLSNASPWQEICKSAPRLVGTTLQFSEPASRAGGTCWAIQSGEERGCSSQMLRVRILASGMKDLCAAPHAVNVLWVSLKDEPFWKFRDQLPGLWFLDVVELRKDISKTLSYCLKGYFLTNK